MTLPGIEKDEFEIETRPEHEHVAMKFDFGNGAARQRVTNGNQPRVLVATVKRGRCFHRHLTHFEVAAAVYHLDDVITHLFNLYFICMRLW